MKKILALALAAALSLSLAACGGTPASTAPASKAPSKAASAAPAGTGKFELALVTDYGSIDDGGFNQGSWEGLEQYAKESGKTYKYYRPAEQSEAGYLTTIQTAVENGAKVVVCPGYSFKNPVTKAQETYPDVKFIVIDTAPDKPAQNLIGIVFAEEQVGYLAGYAAVKDGYKKLGFMGGMAVPPVIRFGYGFAQGADAAAKEMGLKKGDIELMYHYTGVFAPSPDIQTRSASWYSAGTEVIFACGGKIYASIVAAAEANDKGNKKVIGVDVDQAKESKTIITSAMKMLKPAVYQAAKDIYAGSFKGGRLVTVGAKEDAIGLPMATSVFTKFTKADYDKLFADMKADKDGLATKIVKDSGTDGKAIDTATMAKNLAIVTVKEAK